MSELAQAALRISATRGTSSTSTTSYYDFYGAELTVNYTVEDTAYTITSSSTSSNSSISPEESKEYFNDETVTFTITTSDYDNMTVTDNGSNIKSSLVESESNYTYTLSDILTDHTIIVGKIDTGDSAIYIKENGSWVQYSKVYKKINGAWVEQGDLGSLFNTETKYVKKN